MKPGGKAKAKKSKARPSVPLRERLSKRTGLLIGARFVGISLAGFLFLNIPTPVSESISEWLVDITQSISFFLMSLARLPVSLEGSTIRLPNESLIITLECTAIYLMILFAALILAYPATWRSRGIGLLFGVPAIFVMNAIRLLIVGVISYFFPSLFEFVHDYVWQVLFVIMVFMLWLIWMEKVVGLEGKTALRS